MEYKSKEGLALKTGFYWLVFPPPPEHSQNHALITMCCIDTEAKYAMFIGNQGFVDLDEFLDMEKAGTFTISEAQAVPEKTASFTLGAQKKMSISKRTDIN